MKHGMMCVKHGMMCKYETWNGYLFMFYFSVLQRYIKKTVDTLQETWVDFLDRVGDLDQNESNVLSVSWYYRTYCQLVGSIIRTVG